MAISDYTASEREKAMAAQYRASQAGRRREPIIQEPKIPDDLKKIPTIISRAFEQAVKDERGIAYAAATGTPFTVTLDGKRPINSIGSLFNRLMDERTFSKVRPVTANEIRRSSPYERFEQTLNAEGVSIENIKMNGKTAELKLKLTGF